MTRMRSQKLEEKEMVSHMLKKTVKWKMNQDEEIDGQDIPEFEQLAAALGAVRR